MTNYKGVSLEEMLVDLGIRVKNKGQYRSVSEVMNDLTGMWNVFSNETRDKIRDYFKAALGI